MTTPEPNPDDVTSLGIALDALTPGQVADADQHWAAADRYLDGLVEAVTAHRAHPDDTHCPPYCLGPSIVDHVDRMDVDDRGFLLLAAVARIADHQTAPQRPDRTPAKQVPWMDLSEFVASGYLQEVNRRLLHPMGIALAVDHQADGRVTLAGVWDVRDDPGGIVYDEVDAAKATAFHAEQLRRFSEGDRMELHGWWIQPRPDLDPLAADTDEAAGP